MRESQDNKEAAVTHRPLVSVLIPCWGCKDYIAEAIQSALSQTYEPLEVVVVEDCGGDGTYEEVLKIKDSRLRVYRNEQNLGQHLNKNRSLELARGELIKYLDGDDVLESNCVSVLVDGWEKAGEGVGVVFGQFTIIDSDGSLIARPRRWGVSGRCSGIKVLDVVSLKKSAGCMFGNPSPHLIKREALESIGGFPKNQSWSGDLETFWKLLSVCDVVFISDSVARYRMQPGSVGHTRKVMLGVEDNINMVDDLTSFFGQKKGLPVHLSDTAFIQESKVWQSGSMIMPEYLARLRRKNNQFAEICNVFRRHGLEKELLRFARKKLVPYLWGTLVSKCRVFLGLPRHPNLFTRKEARYVQSQ